MDIQNEMMKKAIQQAVNAKMADEVPVGAVIVSGSTLLGEGFNSNISLQDPTAHAEILALRKACEYLNNYRLPDAEVYVTLEPCLMCFHALVQARVKKIYIGARDPKGGFSVFFSEEQMEKLNHRPEIEFGVMEETCAEMIKLFFKEKRVRGKRKWLRSTRP